MVVLGCVLQSERAADLVLSKLQEKDFYSPVHRMIFRAMQSLAAAYRRIDALTLKGELELRGDLEKVGGEEFLAQLENSVASPEYVEYYADIVLDRAILRDLQSAAFDILRTTQETEGTIQDKIISAERAVYEVTRRRVGADFVSLATLTHRFFEDVERKAETGEVQQGVQTRLVDLDHIVTGFYPGNLIVLAARPAVGKTSLALSFAYNVAATTKKAVAIFSLEMSSLEIVRRVVTMLARVDSTILKRPGRIRDEDTHRLVEACDKLYDVKMFVDDSSDISPFEMLGKCRRLAAEHGELGLVVVDYLQLMRAPTRTENRVQQVAEIARGLKNMAKELEVPVVALSQLSRQVVHREKQIPQLSDLRESGSIEADADVVLMLYPLPQKEDDEEAEAGPMDPTLPRPVAILIRKNRNGPTGVAPVAFIPAYTEFSNADHELKEEVYREVGRA
ncbi:MAG: replicative DNA helicase [Fimbriimonadales bacterium]|nr:MAG: replicative DNA helicase [Fimbriimonadales bacterium]